MLRFSIGLNLRKFFLRSDRGFDLFELLIILAALILHLLFLDNLLLSVYPLGLLIIDGLHPDVLDLELDTAEFDDVVLPQLVIQLLLALFETTHDQIHSLGSVCWQYIVLWRVLIGLIFNLVLGEEIVVFRHFWSF